MIAEADERIAGASRQCDQGRRKLFPQMVVLIYPVRCRLYVTQMLSRRSNPTGAELLGFGILSIKDISDVERNLK